MPPGPLWPPGPGGPAVPLFLPTHARRAGASRYRPRSVPTHTRPRESAASGRTRFAHSARGDEGGQRVGVGNSVHVRPPSLERARPRRWPAHKLPSPGGPAASASTYWLPIRAPPQGCGAVAAPSESVISNHLTPRSQESLMPSAVARSEEHTSELQSLAYLVCRLLLEK